VNFKLRAGKLTIPNIVGNSPYTTIYDNLGLLFSNKRIINFLYLNSIRSYLSFCKKKTFYFGSNWAFSILFLFILDALFDGDEPIWEPIEWTLIQTWIIFIFLFSWIGENLITSRFASFTGRDKRVWFAWYKSMWWIEIFYIITLGVAIMLIIVPFYFELNYNSSFIMSFWNWFSKVFFFKSLLMFNFLIIIALFIQINIRFLFYKKLLPLVFVIILILNFIFFTQFYITFFSYFTDSNWYVNNRNNDLIQLSHEPLKWSWDLENRDHFQYHNSRTVFWFKTDGPFAEAFFLINLFYLLSLFMVAVFWLVLFRRIIYVNEFSYNYTLGAISSLKQFYYFYLMFYFFIIACVIIIYLKFPNEFLWLLNKNSWISHFRL